MSQHAQIVLDFAGRQLVIMPVLVVTAHSPHGLTEPHRRSIEEVMSQKYPDITYQIRGSVLEHLTNPSASRREYYQLALSFTLSLRAPERSASNTTGYAEFEATFKNGSGQFTDLYAAIADYRGHAHLGLIPRLNQLIAILNGSLTEQEAVMSCFESYTLGVN